LFIFGEVGMPTYLYRCLQCGKEQEVEHPMTHNGQIRCHSCDGIAERLISACDFILKGKCWAKDGYTSSGIPGSKGGNKP